MSALSAARSTVQVGVTVQPCRLSLPVKAGVVLYPGALVVLSAGYAAPATAATGLTAVGRCEGASEGQATVSPGATVDNTTGSNGDFKVDVSQGVFAWENGTSGDVLAQADVGALVYAIDDQTVGKTDNNGARSAVGRFLGLDASGRCVVDTFIGNGGASVNSKPVTIVSFPLTLAQGANSAVAARFTPGFAGRIKRIAHVATVPSTTGSKLGTLTAKIATVAVTTGALALTSANTDALGEELAVAPTAANEFGATDEITFVWSSVTAFVEGEGVVFVHLG